VSTLNVSLALVVGTRVMNALVSAGVSFVESVVELGAEYVVRLQQRQETRSSAGRGVVILDGFG
jgi:hypothetical protein